jgi:Fe-S-cluster containining protein
MKLSRAHVNGAATEAFERTSRALREARGPGVCVGVARALLQDVGREYVRAAAAGAAVACGAGCAYCCHQRVMVMPHEALALLERVRGLPKEERADVEQRLRANASRVDAMTPDEHRRANLACAFLENGQCRVYDTRPSVCAAYHSLDRSRCEQAFAHPETLGTPRSARPALLEVQAFCDAVIDATRAAACDAGLSAARLELHTALRALLDSAAPAAAPTAALFDHEIAADHAAQVREMSDARRRLRDAEIELDGAVERDEEPSR